MANGTLAQGRLTANTIVPVYPVPSGKVTNYNIRIVNNDPINAVAIRYTHSVANNAQANGEYMLPKDIVLEAGGFFEETALMISGNRFINLFTTGSQVDYNVYGYEK
jgi:hypothetical protein